jgi:hypothetical protein
VSLLETIPDRNTITTIVNDLRDRYGALQDGQGGEPLPQTGLEYLLLAVGEDEMLLRNGRSLLTSSEWAFIRGETDTIETDLRHYPSCQSQFDAHHRAILRQKTAIAELQERASNMEKDLADSGLEDYASYFSRSLIEWVTLAENTANVEIAKLQARAEQAEARLAKLEQGAAR